MIGRVFYADLVVAAGLIFLIFAILTVIYAIIYKIIGVPRYGPMDSPPG
jgi:hypothetical protein